MMRNAAGELRALLMGLSLGGLPKTAGENADIDSEVGMLMTEFDSNQDGSVSREEFRSSLERCAVVNALSGRSVAWRLAKLCPMLARRTAACRPINRPHLSLGFMTRWCRGIWDSELYCGELNLKSRRVF